MELVLIILVGVTAATAYFGSAWQHEKARANREAARADHYQEREKRAIDTIMAMRQRGYEGSPDVFEEPPKTFTMTNEYELEVERAREEDRDPKFPEEPLSIDLD